MIRLLSVYALPLLLASCGSQTWRIPLKDGRQFIALAEPELQTKTGYYRYSNESGRDALLQANEVLQIERLQ